MKKRDVAVANLQQRNLVFASSAVPAKLHDMATCDRCGNMWVTVMKSDRRLGLEKMVSPTAGEWTGYVPHCLECMTLDEINAILRQS